MASSHFINISKEDVASLKQIKPPTSSVNINTIERWTYLVGGSALTIFGVGRDIVRRKPSLAGALLALIGGGLIYQGVIRHNYLYQVLDINTAPVDQHAKSIKVEMVATINRSPEYLAHFLQDLNSLNLNSSSESATADTMKFPEEREKELDAWQALKSSVEAQTGYIQFEEALDGLCTEVKVVFSYSAPLGKVSTTVGKLVGKSPEQQISDNLRYFKTVLEEDENPSTENQS
jgi:uncharacterized membrane protein